MTPPLKLRRLQAEMKLKNLDLKTVAKRARVHYVAASKILNGRSVDPLRLSKLSTVINSAPMPEEVAA